MASTLDEEIKRRRAADTLLSLDDSGLGDLPIDSGSLDQDAAAEAQAEAETDRQLAEASVSSKSDTPDVPKHVEDAYGNWKKWPSLPTIASDQPAAPEPGTFQPPELAPTVLPGHIALGPPVTEKILTAPQEEGGGRYVIDQDTGKMVPHAELATDQDRITQPPGNFELPQVDVAGKPVPRATLVKLPEARTYPTVAEDQGAPGTPPAVQRAQPVVTSSLDQTAPPLDRTLKTDVTKLPEGQLDRTLKTNVTQLPIGSAPGPVVTPQPTAPEEAGVHTELRPPGQMSLQEDIPTAKAVPAEPGTTAQPAVKPVADDWKTWTTVDGTPAEPKTAQTTTAATSTEPMLNAPDGKPPVALIIHHTSGRGDAANVVDGWRTERPGVGSQMIVNRDGSLHYTQQEFGYNGTGHFLHSVIPGVSNQTAVGVEVVAKDDADMTPAQLETLKRLGTGPYANIPVYGHSQVSPGDRENEGVRGVAAINDARKAGVTSSTASTEDIATTLDNNLGGLLSNKGSVYAEMGAKYGVDPKLLASISMLETGRGTSNILKTRNNVAGLGGGNASFASIDDSIEAEARNLRKNYIDQGLTTIDQIGAKWAPPGASNDAGGNKDWPRTVAQLYAGLGGTGQLGGDTKAAAPKKETWESWATLPQAEADKAIAEAQVGTLQNIANKSTNLIGLYKQLDQPVANVQDPVRQEFQGHIKEQIIKLMQEREPNLSADDAWKKAQSDIDPLEVGGDFWNKFVGSFQQFQPLLQQAYSVKNEQSHVNAFLDQALPNGNDADKHALLTKLYNTPREQRGALVQSLIPNPQMGVPGADPNEIVSALDRLSNPDYAKEQDAAMAKAKEDFRKRMLTDPRLQGTGAEKAVDAIAQIPEMLAAAGFMPALAAQVSQQVRDQMKAEHPEYSEDELDQKQAYSTLVQIVGQEAAGRIMGAGMGAIIKGVQNPVQRAIAQALGNMGAGAATGAGTQALSNVVSGEQAGKGVVEAAIAGGLQGGVAGAVHGVGELGSRPVEPEPTIGKEGAPIRGAEDKTLEQPTPAPVKLTPEQQFPSPEAMLAEPQASEEPFIPSSNWQEVPDHLAVPAGGEYKVNMATGKTEARWTGEVPGPEKVVDKRTGKAQSTTPPPVRVSEADPYVSRIANRYTAERIATGELGQVDPSQGQSTEHMVMQGLQMAPEQRERLINNFGRGVGGDLDTQGAAIRSKEAILSEQSRSASRASAADPNNLQLKTQAQAALQELTDFHNGPVKKFKRVWSDSGRALQREIPVDYTTLNGMKEAYLKSNGKEAPVGSDSKFQKMADTVSKSVTAEQAAMGKLGQEIEARTRGNPVTDESVRAKLMEIMKDLPCRN